jgi:hypothetical protein
MLHFLEIYVCHSDLVHPTFGFSLGFILLPTLDKFSFGGLLSLDYGSFLLLCWYVQALMYSQMMREIHTTLT